MSLFLNIHRLKTCFEQQEDALEEQEGAQREAVAVTNSLIKGAIPEFDEDCGSRDVKDSTAQSKQSVLEG